MNKISILKKKILIIGLGYVGLPLAYAFSKKFNVTGYDNDSNKVKKVKKELLLKKKKIINYLKFKS